MSNKIGAYTEPGPTPAFINITTIGENAIIMVREKGEFGTCGRVVSIDISIENLKTLIKGMGL